MTEELKTTEEDVAYLARNMSGIPMSEWNAISNRMLATARALSASEARAEAAEARVAAYEAALDPNQTKHAYIGEVKNEDGRTIAWTATKETMAMIRARASRTLKGAPDGR